MQQNISLLHISTVEAEKRNQVGQEDGNLKSLGHVDLKKISILAV